MWVTFTKSLLFLSVSIKKNLLIGLFLVSSLAHAQWQNVFQPSQFEVRSVFTYNNKVFIGTQHRELFYSDDEGKNWQKLFLNLPIEEQSIENVVATEKVILVGIQGFGIRRSFDNGQTWDWANQGLSSFTINSMATLPGKVFIATGKGVFVSVNEGYSYQPVHTGWPGLNVITLATHHAVLFAGTSNGGLFRYHVENDTWEKIEGANLRASIKTIAFQDDDIFLGTSGQGVIRIAGKSRQIKEVNTGLPTSFIHELAANDSRIFAATDAGLFISADKGQHWLPQNEPSNNTFETVYSVATQEKKVITGIGQQGIRLSEDGGQSWLNIATLTTTASIYHLLPATHGLFATTRKRVFFSDNGQHFQYRSTVDAPITGIAELKQYLFLGTTEGALRSADRGLTWKKLNIQVPVARLTAHQNQIIVVTKRREIMVSYDAGNQWDIMAQLPSNYEITSLVAAGGQCWVGTNNGIFCFNKANNKWKYARKVLDSNAITALLMHGNKVIAAVEHLSKYAVLQSTDAGNTWTQAVDNPLPYPINTMIATPANVIAKDNSGKLFVIADNKMVPWAGNESEEWVTNIASLTFYKGHIMAGTANSGIWSYNLENFSFSQPAPASNLNTLIIYPNPVDKIINLKLNQIDHPLIQLILRDEQGKIRQTYTGKLPNSSFKWDISAQSSGTYILEVVQGEEKITGRIIKK